VWEVHGNLERAACLACGAATPRAEVEQALRDRPGAPSCRCGAALKPGVVLFGELLPEDVIDRAFDLAERSDLLLACGTSLEVYPVAGLADVVRRRGGTLAILTEGPTSYDHQAAYRLRGPLAELLPALAGAVETQLDDRGAHGSRRPA
jgi:NAD-dependent deacetylase